MQLKTGTALKGGEFIIERVLGLGGFGITYLAFQTGLNRRVAVKEFFMSDHCNRDEDTMRVSVPTVTIRSQIDRFKSKFVKEAQTIAALNHPNIIKIISVFEENNTAYYVMEYVEGMSLEQMSTQDAPMPENEAKVYISQVADALKYLHSNNILHLDVKPSNILVNNGKAVLIDFGISKRYDSDNGKQTSISPVALSEGYAPLEQYTKDGIAHFAPATDIYSLGATLYKLVTGCRPPAAGDLVTTQNGLVIPPHVTPHVGWVIRTCMSPGIAGRPQSIDAFMQMLFQADTIRPARPAHPVLPEVPVAPLRPSVPPVPQPAVHKSQKKGGSGKTFLIILSVILGAVVLWWVYGKFKEIKIERTVDRYYRELAQEWRDDNYGAAVDVFLEYCEWYEEQPHDVQLEIDEYEIEWLEENFIEGSLLESFWDYVIELDEDDYDLYDFLDDIDVGEVALDILDEIF